MEVLEESWTPGFPMMIVYLAFAVGLFLWDIVQGLETLMPPLTRCWLGGTVIITGLVASGMVHRTSVTLIHQQDLMTSLPQGEEMDPGSFYEFWRPITAFMYYPIDIFNYFPVFYGCIYGMICFSSGLEIVVFQNRVKSYAVFLIYCWLFCFIIANCTTIRLREWVTPIFWSVMFFWCYANPNEVFPLLQFSIAARNIPWIIVAAKWIFVYPMAEMIGLVVSFSFFLARNAVNGMV